MAIYYIDVLNDNNENTGCSEESPLKSEKDIALKPGDTVLFKRGSFMRDKIHTMSGTEELPIRYGAYGKGDKPIFCGSINLTDESKWHEEEKNIWVCEEIENDEVGNFIFDYGKSYGTLRWKKEGLKE